MQAEVKPLICYAHQSPTQTKSNKMNIKTFEVQITKTGFVLENKIANSLKSKGWTVISNKYYVDDLEHSVREIDLLAYQCKKIQNIDLYTVLIISCKKSESNVWAMLARDANIKDPNTDWWPLHAWSNDKAIEFQLKEPKTAREFHEISAAAGVKEAVAQPQIEVFAFQEMDKGNGAPKNDKAIFSSITSLLKAQAYEIESLPLRKKTPSIYQFNLISVVDTEIIRLMSKDDKISGSIVSSENYITRYIINKKETFSRIRFIQAEKFDDSLQDYNLLHKSNELWFERLQASFYNSIIKDRRRREVFKEEFDAEILKKLNLYVNVFMRKYPKLEQCYLTWKEDDQKLCIEIDSSDDIINFANNNELVNNFTKLKLESIYKYSGKFEFTPFDVPF